MLSSSTNLLEIAWSQIILVFFFVKQNWFASVISSSGGDWDWERDWNVKIPTKLSLLKLQEQIKERVTSWARNEFSYTLLLLLVTLGSHCGCKGWLGKFVTFWSWLTTARTLAELNTPRSLCSLTKLRTKLFRWGAISSVSVVFPFQCFLQIWSCSKDIDS